LSEIFSPASRSSYRLILLKFLPIGRFNTVVLIVMGVKAPIGTTTY
jgi:hypothetical protein